MRQFSVRTVLALVAVCCASLALSRVDYLYGAAAMVAFVLAVAAIDRNNARKSRLIYGVLGGAVGCLIVVNLIAYLCGEIPAPHRGSPSPVHDFSVPFIFPVGGFVGGTVGLLLHSLHSSKQGHESEGTPQDGDAHS